VLRQLRRSSWAEGHYQFPDHGAANCHVSQPTAARVGRLVSELMFCGSGCEEITMLGVSRSRVRASRDDRTKHLASTERHDMHALEDDHDHEAFGRRELRIHATGGLERRTAGTENCVGRVRTWFPLGLSEITEPYSPLGVTDLV
jgi:hypothetical protein